MQSKTHPKETRRFYTVSEIAERLHLSTRTIRRLIERGELDAYRIGRLIRISPDGLQRFIEANRLTER